MKYLLFLPLLLLMTSLKAQITIKQSDLQDFSIGKDMEKHEPQNIRYLDGKAVAPGKYVVLMDQEGQNSKGLKSSFQVNDSGKIDGEMVLDMPGGAFELKVVYKDDILIRVDRKLKGTLVESNYFEGDVFYEKAFEDNGDFKSESRSRAGKVFYSKQMNLSGWDIQDDIKGTRTFYYGKTDKIESRITDKNLEKGVSSMEEKFDEKGILDSKEIKYIDGKRKNISKDGSYEMIIPTDDGGDKITQYSSKGKLLKTSIARYPTMSIQ
jgi:uncharacterized cupredoxin-like copper-binding protein